jgi:hypothetical protein
MNIPHDPADPLLQSLADEAADLPIRAAIEARQKSAHRVQIRQRFALAATVSFLGVVAWVLFSSREVRHATVAVPPVTPESSTVLAASAPEPTPTPPAPEPREDVKVQTEEEVAQAPRSLPTGLDHEQQELVKAAGDLPLLLVRDGTGKVTRIHVIER